MNATLEVPQSRNLIHVRSALYGQPWAITEEWFNTLCGIYEANVAGLSNRENYAAQAAAPDAADELPFDVINNVAVIPVQGPIFPKANLMTRLSGAVALSELKDDLTTAASLEPSAVILNMDSPGGSVVGLADFCEWLTELCATVDFPIIALANPLCGSAAYMIAAQCDAVYATSGAIVGSIGTVGRLDNFDRAQRNAGNDPVMLRSSELKGIGLGGPITPNQAAELQRMMMAHFAQFKAAVVSGRPAIDIEAVATGQTWMAKPANAEPSAQDMGLIDGISTLEKLCAEFGATPLA